MDMTADLVTVLRPLPGPAVYSFQGCECGEESCRCRDGEVKDLIDLFDLDKGESPESVPVPSFDTETGEEMIVPRPLIVPEPMEHPIYILQCIRIGGSDVLVFFARGV